MRLPVLINLFCQIQQNPSVITRFRITQASDRRITQDGSNRIVS